MKKVIGVMGPGAKQATEEDLTTAYAVGKLIAESGAVLLCGAMQGVMKASAEGAKVAGGITVGIGPVTDKSEVNEFIDIPVMTGMGAGRNYQNIISSDLLIFVTVNSPGTLSELAFAIQMNKPAVVIGASTELIAYIESIAAAQVRFVDTLDEIKEEISTLMKR